MSALFPKYHELICNTYTPPFVAGTSPSLIGSGDITRSRLVAGGTFFRSVDVLFASNVNDIILQCVVVFTGIEGTDTNVYDVDFTITDPVGNITIIPTFTQKYNTDINSCVQNGVSILRSLLASNSIVNMPTTDVQQSWNASSNDSDCLLSSFGPTKMSGGAGVPTDTDSIRSGPAFTLFHVYESEENNANGSLTLLNQMIEWDGTQWINHPSTLYSPDNPPPCP